MTAGTLSEPLGATAEPRSIDLRECWLIVRRRWVLVLVIMMIGAFAGAGYGFKSKPSYAATSEVLVTGLTQGPLSQTSPVNLQVNMSTEQAVAQSPVVIAGAAEIINTQPTGLQAAAAKRLSVTVPASTLTTSDVLEITWKAAIPQAAQAGANAFATAYLSYRHRELAEQIASLESVLNKQVITLETQIAHLTTKLNDTSLGASAHQGLAIQLNELTSQATTANNQLASLPTYNDSGGTVIGAALPTTSSGLSRTVIFVLGALLGLLIGLVFAFVRDALDDRVRDPVQLERRLEAPVLGMLPAEEEPGGRRDDAQRREAPTIVVVESPDSRAAEAVRALRATLVAVAARRSLRTILVLAADGNVSSGRIVAELGVALAESGRRVLLVAADMRASVLPQIFDLSNSAGLSDLLVGGGDPNVLTLEPKQVGMLALPDDVAKQMQVLPSGPQIGHSLSLLDSSAMMGLLQDQREAYEFVLLDAPPATVAVDAFAIAGRVDGVIVIARAGRTRGRSVEETRRRLDQVGAVLVGGVFIGKGKGGRHRHQYAGPQTAVGLPTASPERHAPGQASLAAHQEPDVTMPLGVISDHASRAAGGSVKQPL